MFGLKVRIGLVLQMRFDLQARKALAGLVLHSFRTNRVVGLGLQTSGRLAAGLVVVQRKAQVGLDFVLRINFAVLGCLLQINFAGLDSVLRINLVVHGCGLARRLLRTRLVVDQRCFDGLDQTRLAVLDRNHLVVLDQTRLVVLGQSRRVVFDQKRLVVLDQNHLVVFDQKRLVEISFQKTIVEEQHLVDRTNFACLYFASFV